METVIKISPSEINDTLIDTLKHLINGKQNIDVTISLQEYDAQYANALTDSIEQAETGENLVSFAMEDFMAYNPSK
ncbi:MAG: hypothetical protein ABIX01_10130 [Chitinophagaceae bacterium]